MRRVELIIDMARKLSGNTRYDADSGIPQDVFVQILNNAQDSLIMEVQNLKTKYFKKELIVPIVSGQEVYSYPSDCYMQHLDTVQWSDQNNGVYWNTLYKAYTKEKVALRPGYPFAYIPYENGIHLSPPINNGQLWLTFVRTPDSLQKRAGKVSAVTITSGVVTALTVDPTEASFDMTEINNQAYLCVCDSDALSKAKNIKYASVNSSGVFTMNAFTLASGDTISVGDYIMVGQNTCNLPQWPQICEGYLIKHCVYEAKYGDSSQWSKTAASDMERYFQKLSGSFATLNDDLTQIEITNLDYIGI